MKKFSFGLQAVLQLRDFEKQDAYRSYGAAIEKRNQLEQLCHAKSAELKALQERISEMRASVFPASSQPHFFSALMNLEDRLKALLQALADAEKVEQHKLNEFLEARAKVDTLEKLKENRYNFYLKEVARMEELEMDDLVGARYKSLAI